MSSEAATPRAGGGAAFVLPLYTLTLFLSAFLLFAVQPMFTKMVLPLLGGSAAVWNTAVVFFQATLLLGYAYAHFSSRWLGPKAQTILHGLVLLAGLLCLPIGVADWTPPEGEAQIPWLIGLLAISIGLPYFAISATAPLLQKWFAHTDHAAAGDPYFLYGGSNLGSLAALLAYPVLVEPALGLASQGVGWTIGYALLAASIAACAVTLVRRYRAEEASGAATDESLIAVVTWKLRARWLALSTVPSALLLGVTLHVGTNIAAAPFLWVLPLALYLFTFVLVFARRQILGPRVWLVAQIVFVTLLTLLYQIPDLVTMLVLHIGAMFFTAMVCHGELARLRPRASHLTEFYLWMSIGGVLGGFLSAIVAPLVFNGVYEYPLALLAALLLRGRRENAQPALWRWALDLALPALLWFLVAPEPMAEHKQHVDAAIQRAEAARVAGQPVPLAPAELACGGGLWREAVTSLLRDPQNPKLTPEGKPAKVFGSLTEMQLDLLFFRGTLALALLVLAVRPLRFTLAILATLLALWPAVMGKPEHLLMRERSFFGVYSVNLLEVPGQGVFHFLMNGGVLHGGQNMDRPLGPTTYYTREGPVGQTMRILKDWPEPVEHIGVIGLGVGAMAPYVGHGQRMTYYEIDPLDEVIARDTRYFRYLPDAGDKIQVRIGDGRRLIEKEPDGTFNLLLVAAFSGDAIPVHLMTREAFQLYARKLSPRGLILLNVTNAYLDLRPIVANIIADLGMVGRFSHGFKPGITAGGTPGTYCIVARRPEDLARFGFISPPWPELVPDPSLPLWTDDFSSILEILDWKVQDLLVE
jgi:hypothetical protein